MSLLPSTRLGPCEVLAPLGAGGMGEVYRARFEREAQTISELNHPNICVLYDIEHVGEADFLVMELVQGDTLAARLEPGPLPVEERLHIGIEMAEALDRAHKAGVVPRDLKPGNVMLARTGVNSKIRIPPS